MKALGMIRPLAMILLLADPAPAAEVDVELALMVDVSRSMQPNEQALQRKGYAEALQSANVFSAINAGFLGRIALLYAEWSRTGPANVIVPWTIIETPEDARAFAEALDRAPMPSEGRTSIGSAIAWATDSILTNEFDGLRKVIDVSGDGPNNAGYYVDFARDAAIEKGMIINGLPLMTRDGAGMPWHLDDLDVYYRNCVIGGPGAFLIPVHDWSDLARAVRQKIVLELADAGSSEVRTDASADDYDCQIGEKKWEEFRRGIDMP